MGNYAILKSVLSAVATSAIISTSAVIFNAYPNVAANTKHRVESKDVEILQILTEIKANQVFLLKKYDSDMRD